MPVKIKNDSTWQDLGIPMTRVSGEWKPCKQVWTKVSNEWKKVFDLELADDFNGSGNLDGQFTPGHSKWKVYRGSFTKNGSGNVTAGSLNSVAGIETGTDKNIELQIDPGSASESGTGVAFWIQDQSNWWGAQSFYQAYSFSNSPVTGSNFYSCTYTFYTATKNTNASNNTNNNWNSTTSGSFTSTGQTSQTGTKTCQGGRWSSASLSPAPCSGSCTETGAPFNTPCSPNGSTSFIRNCGSAGSCTNCSNTTFPTNTSSGTNQNCPAPASLSPSSICSGTGSVFFTTTYSCTLVPGTPGTFANCDHTASPGSTFPTNILSFDNRGYTDTTCTPASSASCVYSVQNFVIPGNTVNSTFRQTKLIRSVGGTVSDVSGTINNIGDANTIGGMTVQLYSNQVIVRPYSAGSKGGTAFPAQTYSIPAGITKGTKHGIVVSGVPTSQGYNISRFKATLI